MTVDTERWLESAFETAHRQIPLPPEERWVPQRTRIATGSLSLGTIAIAALMLAIGWSIAVVRDARVPQGASRGEPGSIQTAVWERVRSDVGPDVVVLRPGWLPQAISAPPVACGYPAVGAGAYNPSPTASEVASYAVEYNVDPSDDSCARLRVSAYLVRDHGVAVINALPPRDGTLLEVVALRGTSGELVALNRDGTPQFKLTWAEGPVVYRIVATGLTPAEVKQIARSLQDVR